MRTKAIQDLTQYSDKQLFEEIAEGLSLCVANAQQIHADCVALAESKRFRGAKILNFAAQEEASKVLILVDAIRCPRSRQEDRSRQFNYFNDHLPKMIYAESCGLNYSTFGEMRRHIEAQRKEFFLDGPNDVDWIFYNEILTRREDTIYVNFVEYDGDRRWQNPRDGEDDSGPALKSYVIELVQALEKAGCLSPIGLKVMADFWRTIQFDDNLLCTELQEMNSKTLELLQQSGNLKSEDEATLCRIINEWIFPLYPLDLRKEKVDKKDLKKIQEEWSPNFY